MCQRVVQLKKDITIIIILVTKVKTNTIWGFIDLFGACLPRRFADPRRHIASKIIEKYFRRQEHTQEHHGSEIAVYGTAIAGITTTTITAAVAAVVFYERDGAEGHSVSGHNKAVGEEPRDGQRLN